MKLLTMSSLVVGGVLLLAVSGALAHEHGHVHDAPLGKINDALTVTALIETEFRSGKDFAGESSSDLTPSSVELGFDFTPADWAAAHPCPVQV